MTSPAAGWYDDPAPGSAPGAQRYWDGSGWTEQTRSAPADLTKHAPAAGSAPAQTAVGPVPAGYAPAGYPAAGYAPAGYAPAQRPEPPVPLTHTPDGMELASPGKRLGAYLIDALILTVLSLVLVFLFLFLVVGGGAVSGAFDTAGTGDDPPPGFILAVLGGYALLFAGSAVLSIWYYVIRVRQVGATPGKQMLGLRVRTFHADGQLTWGQVWGRYGLPALINGVVGVTFFVDVLWLLFDKHRQCLHDKAVGTVVVDTTAPRAPEQHPGVQLARAFPAQRGWVADGPNPQTPASYPR
jgi:uncharacterized RDD family membrane protein YckC